MLVQYQIFKDSDNQWYWRLVDKNGKTIATSEGYKRRSSAIKACQRMPELARTTAISEVVQ